MARISIDSKIRDEWDLEVMYSLEVVFLWILLELGVCWYTVVYILDVYIECLPRVS